MTKKDYELIAAALRAKRPEAGRLAYEVECDLWLSIITSIAEALEAQNGRFDRARFLTACGV